LSLPVKGAQGGTFNQKGYCPEVIRGGEDEVGSELGRIQVYIVVYSLDQEAASWFGPFQPGRIDMKRITVFAIALSLIATAAFAMKGKPDFAPHIFADGKAWGTKVTTMLPEANENNMQSFDKLFVITNSNNSMMQLPVGEAAPGNPMYNGGRWYTHMVEWTEAGFEYHGTVPILKSYDDIMMHYELGHLMITPGTFPDGPPPFFSCPLLPVK
jgi:hypothetical protein